MPEEPNFKCAKAGNICILCPGTAISQEHCPEWKYVKVMTVQNKQLGELLDFTYELKELKELKELMQ